MRGKEIDNDNLILSHIPLAKSIAFKFKNCFPSFYEHRDIIGVAIESLVSCIDTFDSSKGRSFGSYSSMRINGSLIDEVRKNDQLSRCSRKKLNLINSAVFKIENATSRKATNSEIKKELNMSEKAYNKTRLLTKTYSFVNLDSPNKASDQAGLFLRDVISDSNTLSAKEKTEHKDNLLFLKQRLKSLPEKERQIIDYYYFDDLTLLQVSKKIKLSEGRVSQILSKTINSLKKHFK